MAVNLSGPNRHNCSVCNVKLNSDAEFAIHEFSKKHCDNLLRISKNKPIKVKAPKPVEKPTEKNEAEATQTITEPGQFALYGYFNVGEEAENKDAYAPKDYNYDYDPYLQKLAENPYKALEKAAATAAATDNHDPAVPLTNITCFSTSKKKKKRSCQVCNVAMMNIPQYEAHMKSAGHALKLKQTGMGVSAHFVKAGHNLHTIEEGSEDSSEPATSSTPIASVPIAPSELFCEVCDLLLNSPCQFEAHLTGKSHKDKMKLKLSILAKKEKKETPTPDSLYCFTCKLSLNNLEQFNAHKNGKKHKIKCRTLVRSGITIPPEERTVDMRWAMPSSYEPVRYPDLYMKQVNATTEAGDGNTDSKNDENAKSAESGEKVENGESKTENEKKENNETELQCYKCTFCECHFIEQSPFEAHLNSEEHALKLAEIRNTGKSVKEIIATILDDRKVVLPDRYGRYSCGICTVISSNETENEQHLKSILHRSAAEAYSKKRLLEIRLIVNPESDGSYKCQLCKMSWPTLVEYNTHIHGAQHKNLSWAEYSKKRKYPFGPKTYEERNPGVRTKVGGVATDLTSGETEPVPNLEHYEPRIDPAKNVNIGLRPLLQPEPPRKKQFIGPVRPRAPFRGGLPRRPPPSRYHWNRNQPDISPSDFYDQDFNPPDLFHQEFNPPDLFQQEFNPPDLFHQEFNPPDLFQQEFNPPDLFHQESYPPDFYPQGFNPPDFYPQDFRPPLRRFRPRSFHHMGPRQPPPFRPPAWY